MSTTTSWGDTVSYRCIEREFTWDGETPVDMGSTGRIRVGGHIYRVVDRTPVVGDKLLIVSAAHDRDIIPRHHHLPIGTLATVMSVGGESVFARGTEYPQHLERRHYQVVVPDVPTSSRSERDRVIAKAIADYESIAKRWNVSFTVDDRTVRVVVESSANCGNWGTATCAIGECFNVHIGKIIALRRALRWSIADEYTQIPQPTSSDVRVGDLVDLSSGHKGVRVTSVRAQYSPDAGHRLFIWHEHGLTVDVRDALHLWTCIESVKIVDDSESMPSA
jgi:hypothetical protein